MEIGGPRLQDPDTSQHSEAFAVLRLRPPSGKAPTREQMLSVLGKAAFTPTNPLAKCQPAWEKHPCAQKAFCASPQSQLQAECRAGAAGITRDHAPLPRMKETLPRSELRSPHQRPPRLVWLSNAPKPGPSLEGPLSPLPVGQGHALASQLPWDASVHCGVLHQAVSWPGECFTSPSTQILLLEVCFVSPRSGPQGDL